MIKNKWIRIGAIGVLSTGILAACGDEDALDDATPEEVLEAEKEADKLEQETDTAEEQADEKEEEADAAEEQADELEEDTDEAAQEVLDEIDLGNVELIDLEVNYLVPLDWTVIEFEDYVRQEHDMGIADFEDITDLENTVGPAEEIE